MTLTRYEPGQGFSARTVTELRADCQWKLVLASINLLTDDVSEMRSARTTVVIHITDVNDNPPTFLKSEFRVKVREDMPNGTVITNLVAHDADLPDTGGHIDYKIMKSMYMYNDLLMCGRCVDGLCYPNRLFHNINPS